MTSVTARNREVRFLAGLRPAVKAYRGARHAGRRADAAGQPSPTPSPTCHESSRRFGDAEPRRYLRLPHLAVSIVLCAVAVGCTDDQTAQQPTRSTTGPSDTSRSPATTIPGSGQITVLGLSADEEVALDLQREGLIADCMTQAGFDYAPVEAAQFRAEINERDSSTIPLPLSDQLPPIPTGTVSQDPNRDYVQSLSVDARSRYFSARELTNHNASGR